MNSEAAAWLIVYRDSLTHNLRALYPSSEVTEMKINWSRFVIGALVATIICFFSDGFMHEKLLANDWQSIYTASGVAEPQEHSTALLYFFVFEVGRGVLSMFLYVLMRGCCGAGPKTAVLAAIAAGVA